MSTPTTLAQIYEPIQTQVDGVRETMAGVWADALKLVEFDFGLAPKPGGKMLRPALCLLAAGAIGGTELDRYVRLATAFESLHVASLAHDDVIDRALLRRGESSLNAHWDNHAAVLGGDYLVARAVEFLAEYDSCRIIANAILSVRRMAEGELRFFNRPADAITEDDCIILARSKTASLFAEACSAPAYLLDERYREPLHAFGIALGIAFQVVDDLLDVTQTTEQLGKPECGDIAEGKQTLPIMFLRNALGGTDLARLDALKDTKLSEADRVWVMDLVRETGAAEQTQAIIEDYTATALGELAQLPASTYRDSIEGLTHMLAKRTS